MLASIRRIIATGVPGRPQLLLLLRFSTLAGTTSVHQTLKARGFTDAHIAAILRKAPWLPTARSSSLAVSRMLYLSDQLALAPSDLVRVVTSDPGLLRSSLSNTLIPSLAYLRSVLPSQAHLTRAVLRSPWLLRPARSAIARNIDTMKSSGVPDSSIAKLLSTQPRALMYRSARFREILDAVLLAGFTPSMPTFVHAIHVKSAMSGPTWEKKVQAYLSSGWSVEETRSAFRSLPVLYAYSEERIKQKLDFLMNVVGFRPAHMLSNVKLMTSSLEKTIMPRCCVLNLLMGKGLVKKDMNIPAALCRSSTIFSKMFVDKHKDDVPEVLDAYQGRMEFSGFLHR